MAFSCSVVTPMPRKRSTPTHQKRALRPGTVPAEPKKNPWEDMIRHYIRHPVDFVKDQFGVTPDDWQGDALNALAKHDQVAVRSGHGVGKSTTEVWSKYWFLFTRPHARVPCTAPGRPQLEDVLWPESAKWLQNSKIAPFFRWTKTKVYFVGYEETWFATMRTAAKPENMQGFHGDHMLWILDEASGLEDEITEVIEGSLTGGTDNKILMCGNPTQLSGLFHRAFHREADLWRGMKISCLDSPRVSKTYIEKMRRFGEDSDIYRVRVLGEFPRGGMDTFLVYGDVQKATYRVIPEGVPVEMGLDVARFGCFDDKTEILTDEGWKFFADLKGSERVLTLPESGTAEWGPITQVHRYDFDGHLNVYDGARMSFSVTDNHNMLVRGPKDDKYQIRRFDSLPKETVIRRTNRWSGSNPSEIMFRERTPMPNGGVRERDWRFDFVDFASFIGWFCSEGNVYQEKRQNGRQRIIITQNPGEKADKLTHLLDKMGFRWRRTSNGKQFEMLCAPLASWLIENCGHGAQNKKIPHTIKEATTEAIEAFLEAYKLGDGTVTGSGTTQYITCSRQMADDLHEVLAKLGCAGKMVIKERAGSVAWIEGRKVVRDHDVYLVTRRSKPSDSYLLMKRVENKRYTGEVVCVSTPHRTILVRRNGCIMWSGNSDSTVFAVRKGLKLLPLEAHGQRDTVWTADKAAELIKEHGVTRVKVDDTGVGGGVTDNLRRLKREGKISRHVEIVPVNNGGKGDEFYDNTGALAWGQFKDILPFVSIPDDDEELFDQLVDRRKRITPKGKIALEPKSEMKSRGKPSPDRADAVVLAFFEADIPAVDAGTIGHAFQMTARGLWAPSRWKQVG